MKLNLKDYIYIATLVIGALLWWRDEVKDQATAEADLRSMHEDVSEIKSKLNVKFNQYDLYWMEQKEVNGSVITALGLEPE
jgi:hypothetical protein